ncbi:tyrosine-protein phosphatase [Micromonospora echinospora]|uniref:tyrosine-protein phosphatase n=1 Tax=Micromonospora echinospora TaxID=1877 RepID=UPI002F269AFC
MIGVRRGAGVLDWSGCRNARDLGGLSTSGGHLIRRGALLRSDSHERLAAPTVEALRSGQVSRIVDLRWAWECEQRPSPFVHDPVYRHVPMLDDVLAYIPPPDTYAPMLDHNRHQIAAAFRAVAEAPPGGVLVHCTAGRDRTGVLVALLLTVAGVAAEDIAADYALTDSCSPQPMRHTLAHLDQRHGGVRAYLLAAGVGAEALAAVRERLLSA